MKIGLIDVRDTELYQLLSYIVLRLSYKRSFQSYKGQKICTQFHLTIHTLIQMSLIFDLFPLISHSEFDSNVIQMLENVPAFLGYLKFPGTCHVPIFLQTQLQSQVSFFVSF